MSWKGFTKAISRLPQRVMAKAGYAEETYDEEFSAIEAGFKEMEASAKNIVEDTRLFKVNVKGMITSQKAVAVTLDQIERLMEGPMPKEELLQDYTQGTVDWNDQVLPGLEDQIQAHVIEALQNFWEIVKGVRHTVDKRNRKQVDYDRHLTNLKKAQEKLDQGKEEVGKVAKLDSVFQEARQEYEALNEAVKQQIPQLAQLRINLMDPVFECLMTYQVTLYYSGSTILEGLSRHLDLQANLVETYQEAVKPGLELIKELTIINPRTIDATAESRPPITEPAGGAAKASSMDDEGLPSYSEERKSEDKAAGAAATMAAAAASSAAAESSSSAADANAEPVGIAVSLYAFESDQEGDLPFGKDQKIEVLKMTDNSDDWWTGRIGSKVGFFPANYVEIQK